MASKKYNNVKEIIEEYKYNRKFQFYSKRHAKKISNNRFWSTINNNNDVSVVQKNVENSIRYYQEFEYKLAMEDIDKIEIEIGKYELAVSKIIQCFNVCDFSFTADELSELINNLDIYEDELRNIRMRLCCQD